MKKGLLVAGAFALLTPAFATATENPFAKDETVLRLDGIDLSTVDGQQRLAIRMDAATRAVCGDRLASVSLVANSKAQACRAAVAADIRTQIEARTAMAGAAPAQLASVR